MRIIGIASSFMFVFQLSNVIGAEADRAAKQKELDGACENAREEKLAPLRQKYIEECVEEMKKDRAYCKRFYSDYGAGSSDRVPMFYDLPECVTAFEYRKSYRQAK